MGKNKYKVGQYFYCKIENGGIDFIGKISHIKKYINSTVIHYNILYSKEHFIMDNHFHVGSKMDRATKILGNSLNEKSYKTIEILYG